tara:strand:- start:432 stop:863 length:432 start_codon:yes stop_codon:yes gene_type:complete
MRIYICLIIILTFSCTSNDENNQDLIPLIGAYEHLIGYNNEETTEASFLACFEDRVFFNETNYSISYDNSPSCDGSEISSLSSKYYVETVTTNTIEGTINTAQSGSMLFSLDVNTSTIRIYSKLDNSVVTKSDWDILNIWKKI